MPGETVVVEKVVTETVEVPGETVVVEKVVTETVEVPGETVVKEVVKTVEVPGETVVVEKEVVKEVMVPGETVVVTEVMVKEVAGKKYVTDPVIGNVIPAPEYGGTLVFAGRNTWDRRLDPYVGGPGMSAIASGVMEKLGIVDWTIDRSTYSFGGYPPPISAMVGSLAESWDVSHTGTTHTFNIRPGVMFHDKAPVNGREMDAYDVEFSFHRMLGNKLSGTEYSGADPSPGAGSLGALPWKSVTATDKWTVVFELEEPRFFGPRFIMDWYNMFIYPPEDDRDLRRRLGLGQDGRHRAIYDNRVGRGGWGNLHQESQLLSPRRKIPGEPAALHRRGQGSGDTDTGHVDCWSAHGSDRLHRLAGRHEPELRGREGEPPADQPRTRVWRVVRAV